MAQWIKLFFRVRVRVRCSISGGYHWSVGARFDAILKTTGLQRPTLSRLLTKILTVVKHHCIAHPPPLGGRGTTTQIDEAEFGHVQKAHKGRPSTVMLDVWGAIDQDKGFLVLAPFQKLDEKGERRFGPAKAEEVLPLVTRYVSPGGWVFSDRLRAYRTQLGSLGYNHIALNHSEEAFVHPRYPTVHTQTIESGAGTPVLLGKAPSTPFWRCWVITLP